MCNCAEVFRPFTFFHLRRRHARQSAPTVSTAPPPVTFTADQDHRNMMDQLGIKALRPGPSGNEKASNHAITMSRRPISIPISPTRSSSTTASPSPRRRCGGINAVPRSWTCMRSTFTAAFQNVPSVKWTVTAIDHEMIGFNRVIAKDLIGEVDNASYPASPSRST